MDDWAKIVIGSTAGAVAGFIAGILTEPIKLRFQQRSKLVQMRNALYREMSLNLESLLHYLRAKDNLKPGHSVYTHDISKENSVLQQAKQDYLYARISGLQAIESFYRRFQSLKGKDWDFAKDVAKSIKNDVVNKRLERRRLFAYFRPETEQLFEELQ